MGLLVVHTARTVMIYIATIRATGRLQAGCVHVLVLFCTPLITQILLLKIQNNVK